MDLSPLSTFGHYFALRNGVRNYSFEVFPALKKKQRESLENGAGRVVRVAEYEHGGLNIMGKCSLNRPHFLSQSQQECYLLLL